MVATGDDSPPQLVRFGVFELDLRTGELRKSGAKVRLQEQPFQLLALLLEKRGEVVTREELQRRLWPSDTFVDFDRSLNTAVRKLRGALDDSADNSRYVETLARRGYRFIAPVETLTTRLPEPRIQRPRMLALIVVAIAALAALLLYTSQRSKKSATRPIAKSVAVLPFTNMSSSTDIEFIADGVTEEIINALAHVPDLNVVSRTSVFAFKGRSADVREIGKTLGVESVVEGTVRQSGNRLRVTAKLVSAKDGFQMWSDSYDRDVGDVFAIQNEIARSVAEVLQARLHPGAKLVEARTRDLDAYDQYLRGRHFSKIWTHASLEKSIAHYREAVTRDPSFAPAHAGLAEAYSLIDHAVSGTASLRPQEAHEQAIQAAEKALALDPRSVESHAALGHIYVHQGRFEEAERHLQRALELNPNSASARQWYSILLATLGRTREAGEQITRTRQLDPLSVEINHVMAHIFLYSVGDLDKAISAATRAREIAPQLPQAYFISAEAHALKGQEAAAAKLMEQAAQLPDRPDNLDEERALVLALSNRKAEALAILNGLSDEKSYAASRTAAFAYAALGDHDAAIQWLQRFAHQNPTRARATINLPPCSECEKVRADPRYRALRKDLGLPE